MTKERFEVWGLVELMGHQQVAGRITEEAIGGANLVRVDVPEFNEDGQHVGGYFRTVYYGASAIYALHVTGESEAIELAKRGGRRPSYAWRIEQTPALTDGARSRSTFERDFEAEDDNIPV